MLLFHHHVSDFINLKEQKVNSENSICKFSDCKYQKCATNCKGKVDKERTYFQKITCISTSRDKTNVISLVFSIKTLYIYIYIYLYLYMYMFDI